MLSIFEKDAPEHARIEKIFKKYLPAKILKTPSYQEIADCFKGSFKEIIWVSHGSITGITSPYVAPVYYDKQTGNKNLLFKRFFETIAKNLPHTPIKLRIAFCGADNEELPNSMAPLIQAIKKEDGKVDFSPKMKVLSKIFGKSVTNLSLEWLSKSLEHDKLLSWQTNHSRRCFSSEKRFCDKNKICTSDTQQYCNRKKAKYILPVESTL